MWEIYDDLINGIPEDLSVDELVCGNGISYVRSGNGSGISGFRPIVGIILSVFVGLISSFLGIGGGIIHVPILINVLNYPVHIATATSHFVLAAMSLSGTVVHVVDGVLQSSVIQTAALSIGVLFGAQLGAGLSKKIHGVTIIRSLAAALAIVGVRIFFMAL